MTDRELKKVLECIGNIPDKDKREEASKIILKAVSESITLERLNKVSFEPKKEEIVEEGASRLKFTKKEIEKMSKEAQRIFAVNDMIITYRVINGKYYQARYRKNGINVSAATNDLALLKAKFLRKLEEAIKQKEREKFPLFKDYLGEWLETKKCLIKPKTYKSYDALIRNHIIPSLGEKQVNEINRKDIQDFLFKLSDNGILRTAHKAKTLLKAIFSVICYDYGVKNPLMKVELQAYVAKKGRAFSKEEEWQIIKSCMSSNTLGNSSLLLMMYTGMRVGELKSVKEYDDYLTCVSEKTRMGRAEEIRKIPFSPMLKRIKGMIDFEQVRKASNSTIRDALKRIFSDRHVHEFRYTFITRAKECGINPEVVMLWTGHKVDSDVKTSKVDRGYTTYSDEYVNSEMLKYDYKY